MSSCISIYIKYFSDFKAKVDVFEIQKKKTDKMSI